jgi:hypothetical protein
MCDCAGVCGCQGAAPPTPEAIDNRPALGQVAYRAGRYATFRASMIAALSGAGDAALAPLAALRTRDPADFTIALLDAWAVVLDILTFYSERVANEAFLRTAVEQRSVIEIAALVGYVPSPGVSASATLAFTLASAPGSPAVVPIPAGSRVQSVPGPGQSAQVFETSADLTAQVAWNALPAQTTVPWFLAGTELGTWFAGTSNNLSAGDALLFAAAPGGELTVSSTTQAELHFITAVSVDPVANTTQVTWDTKLTTTAFADGVNVYVFRQKAALFGASAAIASATTSATGTTTTSIKSPPYAPGKDPHVVFLDAIYPGLGPGPGGPQWLALTLTQPQTTGGYFINAGSDEVNEGFGLRRETVSRSDPGLTAIDGTAELGGTTTNGTRASVTTTVTYAALFTISAAQDENPQEYQYNLSSRATALTVDDTALPLAGYPESPEVTDTLVASDAVLLSTYITATPQVTAYLQSEQLTGAPLPQAVPVQGQSVVVVGGQQILPGQPAAVSGQRIRLPVPVGANSTFTPAGPSGSSGGSSGDGQIFLLDSSQATYDQAGNALLAVLTTGGVAGTLLLPSQLSPSSITPLPADQGDPVASEAVIIQSAAPQGGTTTLSLAGPLSRAYDPATVTVNANAVLATHGQSTQEILGSGDATNAALSFSLKQGPLSYLTGPVSAGAQSTLQVWVNNLRWQEQPNLLGSGPADRVYTTSVDATGHTVVRFGDGTQGGRPPTGQANIRAVYRTGTGTAGMVAAGQLSQPLDRPQGLSAVTNPSPATGGQDPAAAAAVRASAPLPTLTLGRVVSLQDYQDYALAFAGIGLALATYAWSGGTRGVFLTVAGAGGAVLAPADPIFSSLVTALRQAGDPNVPLSVTSYVPVLFTFTAGVAIDTTGYDSPAVLSQAWQGVSAAFAFGQRGLGQGVAASEIIEVIQAVPGVVAVRLTGLQRSGDPATAGTALPAAGPQPPSGTQPALGAELLLLDPATAGQLGTWS